MDNKILEPMSFHAQGTTLHSFPFPSFLVTFSLPFSSLPFSQFSFLPISLPLLFFFFALSFPFADPPLSFPLFSSCVPFPFHLFPFPLFSFISIHFFPCIPLTLFSLSFFPALPHFPFRKEWGSIWHAGGFATETGSVVLAALLRSRPCFLLA